MQDWIGDYIHGLSSSEYHFHVGVLIVVLGYLLYRFAVTYHRFRFIRDTATSRINSAAQGYVELSGLGELLAGPVITSPFSNRRCLWYECILEKRQHMKDSSDWEVDSTEISDHLFKIQDETGECIIIPDGAHVIESQKRVWYGNSTQDQSRSSIRSTRFSRWSGHGEYRFTEKLIAVADTLYVTGFFETIQSNIQPDAMNGQVETLIETWKSEPSRYLSAFNQGKDGKINKQEWKKIRLLAEHKIVQQQSHTVHHTLKKPQLSNQPFIISALPQAELLKKKRVWIALYLALFFILLYILIAALKAY